MADGCHCKKNRFWLTQQLIVYFSEIFLREAE